MTMVDKSEEKRLKDAIKQAKNERKKAAKEERRKVKEAKREAQNCEKAQHCLNSGISYLKKGDLDSAISKFQKAIKIKPDFVEAHYGLGEAYVEKGQYDDAIKQYENVITLKPDEGDAHYRLGSIYGKKALSYDKVSRVLEASDFSKQYRCAVEHLQQAVRIKPELKDAHELLDKLRLKGRRATIIRNNAFRVLGLPITASDKDIASRYDELIAFQTIHKEVSYPGDLEWLGKPDRSEESLRKAMHVLQSLDNTKMQHVIFWFWEDNEIDKIAIESLNKGNKLQAIKIWTQAIEKEEDFSVSYLKNMAILYFANVIDMLENGVKDAVVELERSIKCFSDLINYDQFWRTLGNYLPDFEDTPETRDEIAKLVLLHTFHSEVSKAYLLLEAYLNGKSDILVRYLHGVKNSNFPLPIKEEIKHDLLRPIVARVETEIDKSKHCSSDFPTDALSIGNRLAEETEKSLEIVNSLLDKGDEMRISINDRAADELCTFAIKYGNRTEDYERSASLLMQAKRVAHSDFAVNQIEENLTIYKKNIAITNVYKRLETSNNKYKNISSWWNIAYDVGKEFATGLKDELEKVGDLFGRTSKEYTNAVENCALFLRTCAIKAANESSQYIRAEELIGIAIELCCYTSEHDRKKYTVNEELTNGLYEDKCTLSKNQGLTGMALKWLRSKVF